MGEVNQDTILQHQRKRRRHKIKLAVGSFVVILVAIILIATYAILSKNYYNEYKENAEVEYKIRLNENEFYTGEYLEGSTGVVASIIKDIEAEFKYKLDLKEEQDYIYDYKILSQIEVKEGSRENSIYTIEEEIASKPATETNLKQLEIDEKFTIDYNEYNRKISKFITVYNLSNTNSTLSVNMYLHVINKYDGSQVNKDAKVMTLNVPLTTKTVDVSIATNVVKGEGKMLIQESQYGDLTYVLITGVSILTIGIIILLMFIKYVLETRSAETMYEQELRKILFNYKSNIQKISSEENLQGYKILKIGTFNEILEMRDTIQAPILMYAENEERTKFMIINNDVLFVYVLGVKEIRNELREKAKNKKQKAKK